MSIFQISKIQVRTGNIDDLPQLSVGELGWAEDAKRLFIGNQPNTIGPIPDNTEILTTNSTGLATPAGNIYEIQFNDGNGNLGASSSLTFDGNTLAVLGNITANNIDSNTLTVTGNITAANINGGNTVTANFFIGNIVGNISGNIVVPGANTDILFNNDGNAGASGNLKFNGTVLTLAGNLTATGTLSVTGNANVGNLGVAEVVSTGNISTNSELSVTGTATVGNVNTSGNISAIGNITTTSNVVTQFIVANGDLTLLANGGDGDIVINPSGTGNIDMSGSRIINLEQIPESPGEAASKYYVDQVAQGLVPQVPADVATVVNLSATYDNGTAGLGATLTFGSPITTLDGVTLVNGMRILVKDQADPVQNGAYDRTSDTVWTRETDDDAPGDMPVGSLFFVNGGTVNSGTAWVQVDVVVTIGVSPVEFYQISSPTSYTAGVGLEIDGRVINILPTGVTPGQYGNGTHVAQITINDQGQISEATSIALTSQIGGSNTQVQYNDNGVFGASPNFTFNETTNTLFATNLRGNGSQISGITGANITGTVANASYATNAGTAANATFATNAGSANTSNTATSATTAATVTTASQPNITSVGTLSSLTVTGDITGGNLITGGLVRALTLTTGSNAISGSIVGDWTLTAGSTLNATYADLAEIYSSDAEYEPGTVLVFGGDEETTISNEDQSTAVAGVVSTNPGYVMNSEKSSRFTVQLALVGRVPTRVRGPVRKGDLMVSADNGYARAESNPKMGSVIGKSIENFNGDYGIIEVVVGRV